MIVDDKFETKTFCMAGDQVGINVRNWRVTDIVGGASFDAQDYVDALSLRASFLHRAWMPDSCRYLGMQLYNINVAGIPSEVVTSAAGGGLGNQSSEQLPRQVAGLIHLKTLLASRHGRGRMYIPFGCELWNTTNGDVSPTALAILDSLRILYGEPQTVSLAGVHCQLWPAIKERATNVLTLVFNSSTEKRWATQRRRGQFGRQNPIPEL